MGNIHNQKGQSLVEFAIIVPILLLIVMGIFQFGMMLNAYLTIENVSREGARIGIIGSSDAEINSAIIASSSNLDPLKLTVSITPDEASRKSGDTLTVKVTYNYELTIPIISNLFNSEAVLNGQTSMRIE